VTQAGVMARLALRELWISFRVFGVLAGFVGVGALVALLPAPMPATLLRLALGLGVATCLAAAVAAWSMAEERRAGRAAWLVTRSLPRGTLLAGWFVALATIGLLALLVAGLLGWLAVSSVALRLAPGAYAALIGGVGASLLAAIAGGLLAGAVLRPAPAALLAGGVVAGFIALGWLPASSGALLPGGAFAALAALVEPGTMIGPGLRAAGIGLALTAALLVLARLVLDRAEL
jgi:ABC-type transport system involved in multi-copper enzyme maturation permease subunit